MNVELLPLCRDSKEEDEAVKPHVDYLWRHVGNQSCFQCGQSAPRWLESHVGLVLCLTCSGFHRSLGVHLSMVRSLNLDALSLKNLVALQLGGNARARTALASELETLGAHIAERGAASKAFFMAPAFTAYRTQVMKEVQNVMGLYAAIRLKNLFLVQQALTHVDFTKTGTPYASINSVQYALHLACAKGAENIVDELIRHQPPINSLCRGESPLQIAVRVGAWDVVRSLLSNGCDVPSDWLKKQKKETKEKIVPLVAELRSNLLEESVSTLSQAGALALAGSGSFQIVKQTPEVTLGFSFYGFFPPAGEEDRPISDVGNAGDPLGVPDELLSAAPRDDPTTSFAGSHFNEPISTQYEPSVDYSYSPSAHYSSRASTTSRTGQSYSEQAKKYVNLAKTGGSKVVSYVKHWRTGGVNMHKTPDGPAPNLFGTQMIPSPQVNSSHTLQSGQVKPPAVSQVPTGQLVSAFSSRSAELSKAAVDAPDLLLDLSGGDPASNVPDTDQVDVLAPGTVNPMFTAAPLTEATHPSPEYDETTTERPRIAYTFNVADLQARAQPASADGGDVWAMLSKIVGREDNAQ